MAAARGRTATSTSSSVAAGALAQHGALTPAVLQILQQAAEGARASTVAARRSVRASRVGEHGRSSGGQLHVNDVANAMPQHHALTAASLAALRAERVGRRIVAQMRLGPAAAPAAAHG